MEKYMDLKLPHYEELSEQDKKLILQTASLMIVVSKKAHEDGVLYLTEFVEESPDLFTGRAGTFLKNMVNLLSEGMIVDDFRHVAEIYVADSRSDVEYLLFNMIKDGVCALQECVSTEGVASILAAYSGIDNSNAFKNSILDS